MPGTKTKRIVWTMAVLIALSFVAAMVLHNHDEPKVIGNLSKQDVAEISRMYLRTESATYKLLFRESIKSKNFRLLTLVLRCYPFDQVDSLHVLENGMVEIHDTVGRKEDKARFYAIRTNGSWKLRVLEVQPMQSVSNTPTNTAPVTQSGVGK